MFPSTASSIYDMSGVSVLTPVASSLCRTSGQLPDMLQQLCICHGQGAMCSQLKLCADNESTDFTRQSTVAALYSFCAFGGADLVHSGQSVLPPCCRSC